MESISLLGMLFYMSYEDMRTHKVRDFLVLIFGIIGMMFHIMNGRISFFNIFGGFLLGFIMFFISLLTKENIFIVGSIPFCGANSSFWSLS